MRVASWNLLAPKWNGNHVSYCSAEHLAWHHRWPLIQRQIRELDVDCLCCQEVQEDIFEQHLQPYMAQQGYDSLHHPRVNAASGPPHDGVTLHWRRNVFRLQRSRCMVFADHTDSVIPPSAADTGFAGFLRDRSEGACLACLLHKPSGRSVVVCSTHLWWNPEHPHIKLAQAAILCQQLASFAESCCQPGSGAPAAGTAAAAATAATAPAAAPAPAAEAGTGQPGAPAPSGQAGGLSAAARQLPIVVGGDFNSLARKTTSDAFDVVPRRGEVLESGVHVLMTGRNVHPSHPDHPHNRLPPALTRVVDARPVSHSQLGLFGEQGDLGSRVFTPAGLELHSAHMLAHGREPPLTTRTDSFEGCLDYIFLTPGILKVAATLPLPYQYDAAQHMEPGQVSRERLPPMPNATFPSDHLPVGAQLEFL